MHRGFLEHLPFRGFSGVGELSASQVTWLSEIDDCSVSVHGVSLIASFSVGLCNPCDFRYQEGMYKIHHSEHSSTPPPQKIKFLVLITA